MVLALGCASGDEVAYTRNNKEMRLKITHRNNGNFCSVEITNLEEAKNYKARLQKLIKEIEDFENELSIREKQ